MYTFIHIHIYIYTYIYIHIYICKYQNIEFQDIPEQSRQDFEEACDDQSRSEEQYEKILKESMFARPPNHDAFEVGARTSNHHHHFYRAARELCTPDEEIMAPKYEAKLRESLVSQDAQAGPAWGPVSIHANLTHQPHAIEAELPPSNMGIVLPPDGDGCIHSVHEYKIICRKFQEIQDMRDKEMQALQAIQDMNERRLAIFTGLHEKFGQRGQDLIRTILDQNIDYSLPVLIHSPRQPDQQEIWDQRFRSTIKLAAFENRNCGPPRD